MDNSLTPNKSRLSRTFAKALPNLHFQKTKSIEKVKHVHQDEKLQFQNSPTMDAFIAKVFAAVSSVKAAYAQMQVAQSPYNPEGIQLADQIMVSELKQLSEFKQMFLKKQIDADHDINPPETTQLLAEIQEQNNLVQMYDITVKKLDGQKRLQDSEIIFLKEKLNETHKENKIIERRLNYSTTSFSSSSVLPNNIRSFLLSLQQTTRSIKGFVKVMMNEMENADWDLNATVSSIQPNVVCRDATHKCFAFESFVCRVMFDGFNDPGFGFGEFDHSPRLFFESFMELKSLKARDYVTCKPNSMFAKFCWLKYLKLVHPIMEFSLFGNLTQRNLVSGAKFPETPFFAAFADVARRVWLLHCLAFAFESYDSNADADAVSVFGVREGSRFTEVYMENVNEGSPEVGFTVVPGFKVGGTVVQCQVYLN